jgi:(5-formylfuran-3-yl)methyl phosphate synthase
MRAGAAEMKLLISVRSVEEALLAARGGADFIDLKEPRHGALGALPLATIRDCVAALRGCGLPVSATIGDASKDIADAVQRVADCGVDLVKVGIERNEAARELLTMLAGCGRSVVPVLLADRGLDARLVAHAAGLGFAGLMVDTADKRAGSLFDCVPPSELGHFIDCARVSSLMCGLAGALRVEHLPQLMALAPDFAGFRTAVCGADRSAALDADRLRALRQAASCGTLSPSSSARTESSALL